MLYLHIFEPVWHNVSYVCKFLWAKLSLFLSAVLPLLKTFRALRIIFRTSLEAKWEKIVISSEKAYYPSIHHLHTIPTWGWLLVLTLILIIKSDILFKGENCYHWYSKLCCFIKSQSQNILKGFLSVTVELDHLPHVRWLFCAV